jgi:hypothetical protein
MENDILTQQSTRKVYKTNSFAIATILGGPLAAAYMASSNFNSLGESNKVRYTWVAAVLLILLAMVVTSLPGLESVPAFFFALLFLLIVQLLVHRFQAKKIREHIENGGQVYPVSRALAIGLIFIIVHVAIFFGLAYLSEQMAAE